MEDILASIRRIIADDQTRHVQTSSKRVPAAAVPSSGPPAPSFAPTGRRPNRADLLQQPDPVAPVTSSVEPNPTSLFPLDPEQPIVMAPEAVPHINPPAAEHHVVEANGSDVIEEIASAAVASILRPRFAPEAEPAATSVDELGPAEDIEAAPAALQQPELSDLSAEPDPWIEEQPPEPLVSSSTGASIETSFKALATTVFMQNSAMVEQMMREMLRPMLKTWLDDNLPTIVERLVRIEIERVARGGRA